MKVYFVIKVSTWWTTDQLTSKVEKLVNEKAAQGFEIVSVSFGLNMWYMPTAFVTISK